MPKNNGNMSKGRRNQLEGAPKDQKGDNLSIKINNDYNKIKY